MLTISGWFLFALVAILVIVIACLIAWEGEFSFKGIIAAVIISIAIIAATFAGELWYFNNTASGRRAIIDQVSELGNGMDRTINVYTANGDVIASYTGKIDIEQNAGGYIKFDFDGKRYIYYNCFVETIADIP